jgi:hypothetical protein
MTIDSSSSTLAALVRQPHHEALAALEGPDADVLRAVSWTAAHLAAVGLVLHPAVARHLPDGRQRTRAARRVDHHLHNALWELDRQATGDVQVAGVPPQELVEDLRAALAAHERCEQADVAALAQALSDEQQHDLAERLGSAMLHAPSRPHPDTPHRGGPLSRVAFWLDAGVDAARDLMDNRILSVPRAVRPRRRGGRWAAYLMAQPYPSRDEDVTGEHLQDADVRTSRRAPMAP